MSAPERFPPKPELILHPESAQVFEIEPVHPGRVASTRSGQALGDNPGGPGAAVIDVGSNSVRLVLYRLEGRALWTVYNEKVLAGLGRDLTTTGRLSPEGISTALSALNRFRALLDAGRPGRIFAAATAAVRDAADGPAFCRQVREETGLDLRVLTGPEEARYAALGVLAGAPASRGVVGDLGGASLELTRLADGQPARGVTLPLGPFALGEGARFDASKVRAAVARRLDPIAASFSADTLNAVGGAWRNLALLHMRMSDYPLGIVHQYEITRREALDTARFIGQQSRGSLERIEGISRRRVEALPHAAVVLETLIERLNIQTVVMSVYPITEIPFRLRRLRRLSSTRQAVLCAQTNSMACIASCEISSSQIQKVR